MTGSGPIFIPKGFKFSAVTAGIKVSGKPDLALILADQPASAAALFTKNLIVAAPVEVGRASLKQSRGRVRAVVVNSETQIVRPGDRELQLAKRSVVIPRSCCKRVRQRFFRRPRESSVSRFQAAKLFLR